MTKAEKLVIAQGLATEYFRTGDWNKSADEDHAAKCAVRCCATRLNVYVEFNEQVEVLGNAVQG
jgi:hypothetical protein